MSDIYELSLCMPIYNRLESFRYTFDYLIEQVKELDEEYREGVEIVVSLNPSEDVLEETRQYLLEKKQEYDFLLNVNKDNIGGSNNIRKVIDVAHGHLVWVIGDDDLILSGCVKRVLNIIRKYPDVGWIYLAYARLNGYPHDETTFVVEVNNYQLKGGYCADGKKTVIETHNRIGGNMLFSSSNIFLRSIYKEIMDEVKDVEPQLGSAFAAAATGGAYLDDKVGVLAGGCISWGNRADYNHTIRYFKDLYSAVGHGFEKAEIDRIVRYRMRHDALGLWFTIYRLYIKGNEYGKRAFKFFFRLMPVQTIFILFLSPLIAIYLLCRHGYRNRLRRKSCLDYLNSKNPDPMVVSKIHK